jgi:hypothetical protein
LGEERERVRVGAAGLRCNFERVEGLSAKLAGGGAGIDTSTVKCGERRKRQELFISPTMLGKRIQQVGRFRTPSGCLVTCMTLAWLAYVSLTPVSQCTGLVWHSSASPVELFF